MTRPGRPAGPAADTEAVVLTAALELLLAEGALALTPQRLHAVTGVARTTIYRHWPAPRDFLAALIAVAPHESAPPSGDPATDLHAEVDLLCDRLHDKPVAEFLGALVTASIGDPSCAELRRRYVLDLTRPLSTVLAALVPVSEAQSAASEIVAPLLVDILLLDRPVDRDRAHRVAAETLDRIGCARTTK
ncbi:TetR/AcrR family transcriptional regulator [Nocardia fluminea]|uniref:TetR/AcrR family transcriptional regulator n=1 Tax=Nocardia fluminea TaxID=134984 RepID=UPI00364742FE